MAMMFWGRLGARPSWSCIRQSALQPITYPEEQLLIAEGGQETFGTGLVRRPGHSSVWFDLGGSEPRVKQVSGYP